MAFDALSIISEGWAAAATFHLTSQMIDIPFVLEDHFEYGEMHDASPSVRRVVARNPSRFTYFGTGTYIVGRGEVAVIDPGPNLPDHIESILKGLAGESISHILVTHHHSDHSPASRPLQKICGAPVYGLPAAEFAAAAQPGDPAEEGSDRRFSPDVRIAHGDLIEGTDWTIECVHTPGHTSNHVCYRYREEKALFSGDHVMGWSTSVIIPPDGSMSDYLRSLKLLLDASDEIYYPTHGAPIRNPKALVGRLIEHRMAREAQIVECLRSGLKTVREMVPVVYRSTDPALHGAAARSLLATVIKLVESGAVKCEGRPRLDSRFSYIG